MKVAVVGGGPSGFYAAEAVLEQLPGAEVDILEQTPVPYGLVRYGVAPDHAHLKAVVRVFDQIGRHPDVRFFGNVALGRDVSVSDLSMLYDAVIVATGAASDRKLDVPGESLVGVHAARDFVAWYNGHPDAADLSFDLSQEVVWVVGQGNVAVDVCRMLAKPIDELRKTDIAEHALEALSRSRVREIHLVGRRGPAQARFTSKELRELGALRGWRPVVDSGALQLGEVCRAELQLPTNDAAVRNMRILSEFAQRSASADKPIFIDFFSAPVEMLGSERLEGIVLERQRMEGDPFAQVALGTGHFEPNAAGLLLRSVGYFGIAPAGLPYDSTRGVLRHANGRLVDAQDGALRGWYATGWIKRGPSGVIGTNRADSLATVQSLVEDAPGLIEPNRLGRKGLRALLARGDVRSVSFSQWLAIEACERERGAARSKPAEKLVRLEDMLEIALTEAS